MSELNKIVTNFPMTLSQDENHNLALTLSAVLEGGEDGVSPTVTTSGIPASTEHPQGGTSVTITDKTGDHQFDVWNGINGESASVNLLDGSGIHIEQNGIDYTIGVSADYALRSELPDVSDMATMTWTSGELDNKLGPSDLLTYLNPAHGISGACDSGDQYYNFGLWNDYEQAIQTVSARVTIPDSAADNLKNKYLVLRTKADGTVDGWTDFNDPTKDWLEDNYLQTSGGTVSGQLEVHGISNFDQQFLKLTREGVTGHARLSLGQYGELALKAEDSNQHTTQVNISPNTSNDQLIQVQHNTDTVGYLIPAQIHQGSYSPTSADGVLHIVLES